MESRSDRFKKRQTLRQDFTKSKHLRDVSSTEHSEKLLTEAVDTTIVENSFLSEPPVYDLQVSKEEVEASLSALDKQFDKSKYDVLFESSKEVLIDQLLRPFHLSRAALQDGDRDFTYQRNVYMKSPKSSGTDGVSFNTQRERAKQAATNSDGKIKDSYTGTHHDASEMDLDHIKSTKEFHNDGGFMLSKAEKSQFGSDAANHEFTHSSINRSKGEHDLKEFSDKNGAVDKRRTNAAHARAQKAAEKYVPSDSLDKTLFVTKRAAQDGVSVGARQGLQQAIGLLMSEFISAIFAEVKDILNNGFKGSQYDITWIEALKVRLNIVKDKLVSKWKDVAAAFAAGSLSGFMSTIITSLLNMFVRTGKNVVRIIREGFMSLTKALKVLMFPPEGMSTKKAAHAAVKVLATGLVVTGGILIGESIAASPVMAAIPFSETIIMVLTGLMTGLGSLFVVFMLDKLDLFGVNADERHKFIMGELEPRTALNIQKCEEVIQRLGLEYDPT